MSGEKRKHANRSHPLYDEYIKKCKLLSDNFDQEEEKILSQYPIWFGLDHPSEEEIHPLRKKYYSDLRKLQEEYSDVFTIIS